MKDYLHFQLAIIIRSAVNYFKSIKLKVVLWELKFIQLSLCFEQFN
jgi:hypothetical protein